MDATQLSLRRALIPKRRQPAVALWLRHRPLFPSSNSKAITCYIARDHGEARRLGPPATAVIEICLSRTGLGDPPQVFRLTS